MTVQELIKELEKMPQEATVTMFDGPSYYTPCKVFIWDKPGAFKGNVIID